MYERFTDRARKVMQLANTEATFLGYDYVCTGHILAGIIKEGSGVGCTVLNNLIFPTLNKTDKFSRLLNDALLAIPTSETIDAKKELFATKLPQTPRARHTIEAAIKYAGELNNNYIGTQHLLLGLLDQVLAIDTPDRMASCGIAYEVLTWYELTVDKVKEEIKKIQKVQPNDLKMNKNDMKAVWKYATELPVSDTSYGPWTGNVSTPANLAIIRHNYMTMNPNHVYKFQGAKADRLEVDLSDAAIEKIKKLFAERFGIPQSKTKILNKETDLVQFEHRDEVGDLFPKNSMSFPGGFSEQRTGEIKSLKEQNNEYETNESFNAGRRQGRLDEQRRCLSVINDLIKEAESKKHTVVAHWLNKVAAKIQEIRDEKENQK